MVGNWQRRFNFLCVLWCLVISVFLPNFLWAGNIFKCFTLLQLPTKQDSSQKPSQLPLQNTVITEPEFKAEHFFPAYFKSLGGNSLLKKTYSTWSADTANRIIKFVNDLNLEAAFVEVAKSRHRFEEESNPGGDFMLFGIMKNFNSRNHDAFFGNMTVTAKEIFPEKSIESSSRRKYTEEAAQLYSEYLPNFENPQSYREVHTATHVDGTALPIKEFVIDIRPTHNELLKAERVSFYSSSYGEGISFKAFVLAKIRASKALKSQDLESAFREYALSAYAYFGSMPYMRGSAAIGRVVYTVLARKIFKKIIVLDPEIDIRVLMRNEADFISLLRQNFIEQGVDLKR
jgi:hypothetical protein